MNYQTTIYETVGAIPAEEWDSLCAAGEVFMDRRFLAAVERSMAADGNFYFVVVRMRLASDGLRRGSSYRIDGAVLAGRRSKRFSKACGAVWHNYPRMKICSAGCRFRPGRSTCGLIRGRRGGGRSA